MHVAFTGLHEGEKSVVRTRGLQLLSGNRSGNGQGAALSESVGEGLLAEVGGTTFQWYALRLGSHAPLFWD